MRDLFKAWTLFHLWESILFSNIISNILCPWLSLSDQREVGSLSPTSPYHQGT